MLLLPTLFSELNSPHGRRLNWYRSWLYSRLLCRPQRGTLSRLVRQNAQSQWNSYIDEYIQLGKDPRTAEDIARAAKISSGNGAEFKTCQAPNCMKVEGSSSQFKRCSNCKIVSNLASVTGLYHAMCSQNSSLHTVALLARQQTGKCTRKYVARKSRWSKLYHRS